MYISRWITRGVVLAVAAILVPTIMRPVIAPDNPTVANEGFSLMPSAVVLLVSVILAVLAWGQLQYAYNFFSLSRLLRIVANGRLKFKFRVDRGAVATVTYGDQIYRIEVIEPRYEMLTIYIVSGSHIEVRQLVKELVVVPAYGAATYHQVAFEEVPFQPLDLRKEMRRLRWGLQFTLPDKGRFTP